MSSCCILGIILFSLLPVGMADASFHPSYTEKLSYAISSEKMYGHLDAALIAFLDDGKYQYLARAHLGHSMIEEFEKSRAFLQNHPDYYQLSIQMLKEIIDDPDIDEQSFNAKAKEVIQVVRTGQNLILGEKITRDDGFNLLIITSLLETAKNSLIDSQNASGATQIMFKQDALGFVARADMRFKSIDDMETTQFESTTHLLEEYFLLSDNRENVADQIKILDEALIELYYYTIEQNKIFPFNEDLKVPMQPQGVVLKVEDESGYNIASLAGEGFTPSSLLNILYMTSDNKDPIKLTIRTTNTGDFFIPLEFHVNEKTYYVSVSTSKTTTSYVLG